MILNPHPNVSIACYNYGKNKYSHAVNSITTFYRASEGGEASTAKIGTRVKLSIVFNIT